MSFKYDENTRKIRKLARNILVDLLSEKPLSSKEIQARIKIKFPKNCDDTIKCACHKGSNLFEWKHQIAWAIQDVKYAKKIEYLKDQRKYAIIKKEL